MPLPINIHDLVNGQSIEWERLEFKAGWNPEAILHTIVAFANDINNWGGGYIVVGIKEHEGRPMLPPVGISSEKIDGIQKKLLELSHKISPNYFPVVAPAIYEEKHILLIWCPGGDVRPYKAPITLAKNSQQDYFIRRFSSTVKVNSNEELQLLQLAAKVPFDDRINHNAKLEDLNITLIKEYLKEVDSELYNSVEKISFLALCQQMQIVRGPKEYIKPVNIGLLMFNTKPSEFFRGAKIEVVEYNDDVGDSFTEKIFTGPIHHQLKMSLQYIENAVIKESIRKVDGQAESIRVFNYPVAAIEEALANAIYHKNYEKQNTIEVSIYKSRIDILSFPGPLPPISENDLKKAKVIARDYRNRRVGDFLKELDLTEGRGTGIPKIRRVLDFNNSPEPEFHTDENRTYFLSTFYVNSDFIEDETTKTTQKTTQKTAQKTAQKILFLMKRNRNITTSEISNELGITRSAVAKSIRKLKTEGLLKRIGPDKGGYWEVLTNEEPQK